YKEDYSNKFSTSFNMVFNYFKAKPLIILLSYDYAKHFFVSSLYSDILNKFRNENGNFPDPADKPVSMDFPSIASYKRNLQYLISITKSDGVPLILGNQPNLFKKNMNAYLQWQEQGYCKINNTYPNVDSIVFAMNNF